MEITAITPHKKNKNFYNVFIDGEFFCSLDDEAIYAMKLKEGIEVDTTLLEKTAVQAAYKNALNYSLNLLSKYYKTTHELKKKLKEKGYSDDAINSVIEKLKALGYLNDEQYIEAYIRSKQGVNKKNLYNKLIQKGLDREQVQSYLNNTDIDEYNIAMKAAEKKLKSLKGNPYEKKAKLYSYLYSKGFEYETCNKIIDSLEINY